MNIVLASPSDKPLYRQIYEQVRTQIIKGELESGGCLPPIRTVARELRISVITVKGAWEELERDGFIKTAVGKGCFVAPLRARELGDRKQRLAEQKISKDIDEYRSFGLTKKDLHELVDRYFKE